MALACGPVIVIEIGRIPIHLELGAWGSRPFEGVYPLAFVGIAVEHDPDFVPTWVHHCTLAERIEGQQ